jgi:Outer membrane protein beta-barrel domain
MKRFAILSALALIFAAPAVFAQNRGEIGAFADMTRLDKAGPTNFFGVGGRLGINVGEHAAVEAEVAYDFERNFTTTLNPNAPGAQTFARTGLRLIHGLFGPKFQTGGGAVRAFVFAKGGILNFSVAESSNVTTAFTTAFGRLGETDTNGAFYPGGGVEAYLGPVGLRLDVGDLIYFDNGANHNLRITLGPHIRF